MGGEGQRDKLRQLIRDRGYHDYEVARVLHVLPSTLSRWLNRKHEKVPGSVIPALAAALQVSVPEVLEALYPLEDRLQRYDLPPELAEPLRREAIHAGEETWLEDVTEAILLVDCIAPADPRRNDEIRTLTDLWHLDDEVYRRLSTYMHHRLDHYLMSLLANLEHADRSRVERCLSSLWRLAHLAKQEEIDRPWRYRLLQNTLCYLIGFSSPGGDEMALAQGQEFWRAGRRGIGNVYVARDTFYAAGFAQLPKSQELVEEIVVSAFREQSLLAEPAQRVMVGCDALYYAPSLRRHSDFDEDLVPDVSTLDSVTAGSALEHMVDHLLAPLPDIFLAYCAAILLLWMRARGPRLEQDLFWAPHLAGKLGRFLERPQPYFRSPLGRRLWSAAKDRVAQFQKYYAMRMPPKLDF